LDPQWVLVRRVYGLPFAPIHHEDKFYEMEVPPLWRVRGCLRDTKVTHFYDIMGCEAVRVRHDTRWTSPDHRVWFWPPRACKTCNPRAYQFCIPK
jgi:hypothetical protein